MFAGDPYRGPCLTVTVHALAYADYDSVICLRYAFLARDLSTLPVKGQLSTLICPENAVQHWL